MIYLYWRGERSSDMNPTEQKWHDRGEKVGLVLFSLIKPICYIGFVLCFLVFCFLTNKKPPTGSGGIHMG